MYVVAYFIIPVTIIVLNNAQKIKLTRTSCPFLNSVSALTIILYHAKALWILVSFFEEKIFAVLTWVRTDL